MQMKRFWTIFRYTTRPDSSTEILPFTKTIEYNYYNSNNNITYQYVHIYTDNEKIIEITLDKDTLRVRLHIDGNKNKKDKEKDVILKEIKIKNTLELETNCKEKIVGIKWKDGKENKIQFTFYIKEEADEFHNEFNKVLSCFYTNKITMKNIKNFIKQLNKNCRTKINIEKYKTHKTYEEIKIEFINLVNSLKYI
ncbi:hypothetical protein SLOPH_484 [Spraguea lophii 42_110]|uniref:Uncharacterized protein n=1 Tax=Spraguea lophii (strain 42_110) TaxID=1358809 RepID=S7W646_SPRLO|nr:hypothetical protein SLOPH_484 [Spraguea lophii 42_110]